MKALAEPLHAELVVVSDVHLREPDDDRARALSRLIQQVTAGDVGHLWLLGDIFDFCLGSTQYFQRKFAPMMALLEAAARSGTQVTFFEGNHEFDLHALGWSAVEIVREGEKTVSLADGVSVSGAHGDLIYAPQSYLWFRNLIKSRLILAIARVVPSRWLDAYALSHAKVSRAADTYRHLDHKALLEAMENWAMRSGSHHVVFGHFHVPYAEPRMQKEAPGGLLLSLESWVSPNALRYAAGRWERLSLDHGAWEPVQSLDLYPGPGSR